MSSHAYINSFDAVRDWRAALVVFLHEAREAMAAQDLEVRRTLGWILDLEPQRWQQQVRTCEEHVVQAKIDLERCRYSKLPGGETPSCIDERKALEQARQRLAYAEEKVEVVRKWGRALEHDAAEYAGRANQLVSMLDVDLVAAIGLVDRVLSLDAYAGLKSTEAARSSPANVGSAAAREEPKMPSMASEDASNVEATPPNQDTA